ncbi:hypothetical protein [Sediminibacterium salmoneum]|uniref:hypothetical protein n=1 Tax=Sediminibacterium salmoneum TaxID=426421 RepID=UPI00047EF2EA|nr:hypothetical protein [Sediminibacterium salmoneum]
MSDYKHNRLEIRGSKRNVTLIRRFLSSGKKDDEGVFIPDMNQIAKHQKANELIDCCLVSDTWYESTSVVNFLTIDGDGLGLAKKLSKNFKNLVFVLDYDLEYHLPDYRRVFLENGEIKQSFICTEEETEFEETKEIAATY